jgi:hypothetical protein
MHAEKPDRVGFDTPPDKPSIPLSEGFENFLRTNVGEKPWLAKAQRPLALDRGTWSYHKGLTAGACG